ncbi:DUF1715-domain-containing protein [Metschnikowia bicuspidata]|uniref:DUF1715-domain-containing protein n=1 Tax=Metschnikowia bicuspidata TaxID=27322 RepID=A0A4P9Z934_9ASCO|nr:DUF1715-domain-containing protein [Metschnikowia bicuspidata]
MADINLDAALEVENVIYLKGYQEGVDAASNEQFLEGKIYGLQTGFQRFLIVGYIEELLHQWMLQETEGRIKTHLDQASALLASITNENDDSLVAVYEKAVAALRNKVRVIAGITKTTDKIAGLDKLVQEVGGTMAVASNPDEMW